MKKNQCARACDEVSLFAGGRDEESLLSETRHEESLLARLRDEESLFATTRDEESLFERTVPKMSKHLLIKNHSSREPALKNLYSPGARDEEMQRPKNVETFQSPKKVRTFWGILDRLRQKAFPPTSKTRRRAYDAC